MSEAPLLEIRGLRKSFGSTEVLRGIDLSVARGELVLGGAVGEPADGSVLLFVGSSPAAAEAFAAADPYVQHGVVARWRVTPWTTVVGPDAQVTLPPGL